jgi:hypothetical protein
MNTTPTKIAALVEHKDGTKEWFFRGVLHKMDGPARELPDGTKEWWILGNKYCELDWQREVAFLYRKIRKQALFISAEMINTICLSDVPANFSGLVNIDDGGPLMYFIHGEEVSESRWFVEYAKNGV